MTAPFAEGQSIANRFTLARRVSGEPGGELWCATDTTTGSSTLLRLIPGPVDGAELARIREAIDEVGPLVHPSLLRVYHGEITDDGLLIVASEGREHLASVNWQPAFYREQLRLLLPVLDALEYAHQLGRSHGRIGPDTILADPGGRAYLSEFGVRLPPPSGTSGTDAGVRTASPGDDIHALGRLLHQATTGRAWMAGDAAHGPVTAVSGIPLPAPLTALIARMLRPAPYERPGSIAEIRAILQDCIDDQAAVVDVSQLFRRARDNEAPGPESPARPGSVPISRREAEVMSTSAALVVFVVLIALLGGVVLFLPGLVERDEPSREVRFAELPAVAPGPASKRPGGDDGPSPLERARMEQARKEANQLAAEVLRQEIYLEDVGAKKWAAERLQQAQTKGEAADARFREEQYEEALKQFQDALQILSELKESIPDELVKALQGGAIALAAGDSAAAVSEFEIAQAIDPDNEDAAAGLKRAATLDQTLALVHQASQSETDGKLAEALRSFREAARIDPQMTAATEGAERVQRKITDRDFSDAMSRGLAALDATRYDDARSAFQQALQIKPDASAPRDGLEQIELALRLAEIAQHRERAAGFEAAEQWQEAAREYGAAVALDSGLLFATEGRERARRRAELSDRLDRFVEHPEMLTDPDNFALAERVRAEAAAIDPRGPRLSGQTSELSHLMQLAKIPVEVEIRSDRQTEVIVYRVGTLGRIESTTLTLMPGTYRAVGTRRGYRDKNVEFTLVPGRKPEAIYVSCTEKI